MLYMWIGVKDEAPQYIPARAGTIIWASQSLHWGWGDHLV